MTLGRDQPCGQAPSQEVMAWRYAVGGDLNLAWLGLFGHRNGQPQHPASFSASTWSVSKLSPGILERVRRIADLVAAGVNLAGVAMILGLEDANARLKADLDVVRQPTRTARSGKSPSSVRTNAQAR